MTRKIEKYLALQEQLMGDDEYAALLREYREKNEALLAVLEQLEPRQRDVIQDHLGLCVELHTKMLLLACGQ